MMNGKAEKRFSFPFSIALILIGILLLFGNVGWFGLDSLFELLAMYWPLIFVVRGVSRFSQGGSSFGKGLRDIAFGAVMQVIMLGWLPGDPTQYWPYILICVGLWLILVPGKDTVIEKTVDAMEIDESALLRSVSLFVDTSRFFGGKLRAAVSVMECDLSQAGVGTQQMRLDLQARLSRVRLHVPDEWRVVTELSGPGRTVRDQRALGNPPEGTEAPELLITGSLTLASLYLLDPPAPEGPLPEDQPHEQIPDNR